jgi:hypothetical protein
VVRVAAGESKSLGDCAAVTAEIERIADYSMGFLGRTLRLLEQLTGHALETNQ